MAWEYETDMRKESYPVMAWLNDHGSRGWRLIRIDAHWLVGIFEREIEINQKLRQAQLEGDSLWKKERSESSA